MIISILSGKGGTGKTTIATNLALANEGNVQLLDCDVEEPNAHLFIKPDIQKRQSVFIKVPQVEKTQCDHCGICQEVCAFHAIAVMKDRVLIFSELCHSCGACSYFCPQGAIKEVDKEVGVVEIGSRGPLQFVRGVMNVGVAISIPIIKAVKEYINPTRTVILDAPPGTSCPVIETARESDFCVIVTEPTPFGFNDFQLVVELLRKLGRPFGVVINRSDLGNEQTEKFCLKEDIPILMKIPFEKEIASAYAQGDLIIERMLQWKQRFQELFERTVKEQCYEKNIGH